MKATFVPKDYVINAIRKVDSDIESDFLLRAIRIKNTTSEIISIKRISFDLQIKKRTVQLVSYPEQAVRRLCHTMVEYTSKIRGLSPQITQMFLGTKKFWEYDCISSTLTLKPNQETGIILEHFRVLEKNAIDACVVSVLYLQRGKEQNLACKIPIVPYQNKNKLLFPLKGVWLVENNYDNIYVHRRMHSQEFALDLLQLTNDFQLCPNRNSANKDYPSYGKEIYAVADGEVVSCFDKFPENPSGIGSRLPIEDWDKLKKKYGFVAGIAGNYIMLKHSGDEYSFYAHMIPKSLTVKRGDLVKQGEVIGLLGNSGNSDAPHLHFHVMNGPSILSARGLPCRFSNVRDMLGDPWLFVEENNSFVYAE